MPLGGAIDKYNNVFDVDFYKRHRKLYLRRLYISSKWKHDFFMSELYPYFKKEITIGFRIWCIYTFIKNKIFPKHEIV